MPGINQCPTIFCGCQSIRYELFTPSSPSSIPSSPSTQQQLELSYKLYLYIIFIVLFIMLSVKLSLQWFIYKDYYPIKQKSPILTIIMIFSICIQVILYPFIYSVNYFTFIFTEPRVREYFRAIQIAMEFSVYSIYLLRFLRIWYAHGVDKTRRNSFSFWVFKHENVLAMAVMGIAILRALPVVFDPCVWTGQNPSDCWDFAFSFQIAAFNGGPTGQNNSLQNMFIIRTLITNFIWQLLLTYCMYLNKNVNYRYSMQKQLLLILAATQITSFSHLFTLFLTLDQFSTLRYLCATSSVYPMTQTMKILNHLIAFVVTAVIPLFHKKVYHVLLPTGPHYGFIKTMRNFLCQPQFLRVFSKYLEYLDQQQNTKHYTKLLKFWQETLLLKIKPHSQPDQQKLDSIITLVESIQDDKILIQYPELIDSLKGTVNNLQDSQLSLQSQHEQQPNSIKSHHSNNSHRDSATTNSQIRQQLQKQLNQKRKQKIRQSLRDRIDELEQIALQKLNKIYIQKYYYTDSYYYLKQIMNQYKKVNLNLIMLDMALIVDPENDFN